MALAVAAAAPAKISENKLILIVQLQFMAIETTDPPHRCQDMMPGGVAYILQIALAPASPTGKDSGVLFGQIIFMAAEAVVIVTDVPVPSQFLAGQNPAITIGIGLDVMDGRHTVAPFTNPDITFLFSLPVMTQTA